MKVPKGIESNAGVIAAIPAKPKVWITLTSILFLQLNTFFLLGSAFTPNKKYILFL